jgi:osmotically inducible lipoprotein OsmB
LRTRTRRSAGVAAAVLAALTLTSCAGMSPTQQRVLSGGAIGTAGGALIGAMAGNAGMGAAIGAGVGLLGGVAVDQHEKSKQRAYDEGYRAGKSAH